MRSALGSGEPYLKSDVCLRPDLGRRDLKIRLFVHKIHTDSFSHFSPGSRQTLAYWFIDPDDALSSILTVKIITGAEYGGEPWAENSQNKPLQNEKKKKKKHVD